MIIKVKQEAPDSISLGTAWIEQSDDGKKHGQPINAPLLPDKDPDNSIKANPNVDVSLKLEREKTRSLKTEDNETFDLGPPSEPTVCASTDAPCALDERPDTPMQIEKQPIVIEDKTSQHTKRRTRMIIDCVLLWTWADLQRQQEKEKEEASRMMKAIKNPKIKKGIKEMGLQPNTIRSRLKDIGLELFDIQLEKTLIDTLVPRIFLSNTYGGSPQEIHPRIAEKFLKVHGHNDWMFLATDYHPDAPQVPGAPGIYLEFYEDGEWERGQMRIFTRVQTNPNLWQYMGMYEVKLGRSLTKEEWAEQTSLVRMTWASRIANSDWGSHVAARIRARRDLGRKPTRREIENTINSFKVGQMVSPQQVEAAYLAGEEIMGLYTMKCVAYDYAFQRGLCEKFRDWSAPPARPRKKKELKIKRE